MSMHKLLSVLFLITSLLLTNTQPAESAQCAYFNETFTGNATNAWTYNYGTWVIKNNKLNVTNITSGKSAYADTSFQPGNYFSIDVDVNSASALQGEGYTIYPYTSGSTYFSVEGKSLDGLGAIFFSSGNAYLIGWDTTSKAWYQSTKYVTTAPVTSIGVSYSSGAITLRINKQDTTLKFSGSFTDFYQLIDHIDLTTQGSSASLLQAGTEVNFDNVCADPLPTTAVSTGTVTLLSPANGATSQALTPTLSWSATGSPTGYRIFVATDETTLKGLASDATTCSACVLTTNAPTTTSYILPSGTLQAGTKYYWRVKAGYSSAPVLSADIWSFTTANNSSGGNSCTATLDQSRKLNIPIMKYTDQLLGNIYLWANMDYVLNPSRVLFKLKDYGTIQNVSGYTCTMSTLDSDLTFHVNDLSYNGASYWLKLALDTSLSTGSNVYFYAADYGVGTGATGAVTLLSPTNGATSQSVTPTLSWSATGSPTGYRIFVATDETTLKGLASDATTCSACALTTNAPTTTSYILPSGTLQAATKYYWRVKAGYSSGTAMSADIWSFTTTAASSGPYGQFDAKKFVDALFMGKIKVMTIPLGMLPIYLLSVDKPEQMIDLIAAAMPTMVTKITNGVKFDFGKGYYLPGGNRLEGSISLTYSNLVKDTSMNYVISFTNFSHNFGYKTDGSISGSITINTNAITMTLEGTMYSSTGDVTVSGNAQYVTCKGYPSAGSLDFVSGSKKEKITFNAKCDGTYDYTTY